ncbi:nucleotidyltransferase domain-containing protein [Bacillus sp. Marseille-P3661]|uniref:nucleotidyltransferase domain-containing protein n=1 Tax=Bacillus sp. Marseille-P3661 TaxID=1936234 RepID=UPI000C81F614|nr:nucleotidyltransferase domain-containing protein [Bacillus sp. Marseille-P3661]
MAYSKKEIKGEGDKMFKSIARELTQFEKDYACKIIYVVEAGSRVWGYSSQNSDYDIRFIFKHPVRAYCSLTNPISVIEKKLPMIEFHGWDLLKALQLYQKSNPSLYEWLFSSIIYDENSGCIEELRSLAKTHYSLKKLGFHYLSLAKSNIKKEVKTPKMVIQINRALLMVKWIVERKELPPLSIEQLLYNSNLESAVSQQLVSLLRSLQEQKKEIMFHNNDETIIKAIDDLSVKLQYLDEGIQNTSILNKLFWKELNIL